MKSIKVAAVFVCSLQVGIMLHNCSAGLFLLDVCRLPGGLLWLSGAEAYIMAATREGEEGLHQPALTGSQVTAVGTVSD